MSTAIACSLVARDTPAAMSRRLRVENLRLGGDDVRLGGCSGVVLILGDRERALVLDDRLAEQILEQSASRNVT